MRPDLGERVEATESDLLPEVDHGVRVLDLVPVMEEEGDFDLYERDESLAMTSDSIKAASGSPS
jgi:hypothetical protein